MVCYRICCNNKRDSGDRKSNLRIRKKVLICSHWQWLLQQSLQQQCSWKEQERQSHFSAQARQYEIGKENDNNLIPRRYTKNPRQTNRSIHSSNAQRSSQNMLPWPLDRIGRGNILSGEPGRFKVFFQQGAVLSNQGRTFRMDRVCGQGIFQRVCCPQQWKSNQHHRKDKLLQRSIPTVEGHIR